MAMEIYEPIFSPFFPLQSNVKHKSQETKRLGHHKCPLTWIKGAKEKKNGQDDLERFYLLDSFQDTRFTKSGSKSLSGPFLLSPDKFKTASLQAGNSLRRSCRQTLIHVLCLKFHREALIPFFVWTAFCDREHNHQARLLLSSWARDSLMQLETTDAREPCSPIGLWEADSSAGVWGRRCRALVGDCRCHLNSLTCRFIIFQFSSGAPSCLPFGPMDCSTPGLPVHHQLPEFTQTHVRWVHDAIQPSPPLLSPSPPALNLSQQQGLLKWVSSSHQVAKVLEFQLHHQSSQWIFRTDIL